MAETFCDETGAAAVDGACPVHLGDACLITGRYVDELRVKLAAAERELQLEKDCRAANATAVVQTVGGQVEGRPTNTSNYLQRLRVLVGIELERNEILAFMAGTSLCEACSVKRKEHLISLGEPGHTWQERAETAEREVVRLSVLIGRSIHSALATEPRMEDD